MPVSAAKNKKIKLKCTKLGIARYIIYLKQFSKCFDNFRKTVVSLINLLFVSKSKHSENNIYNKVWFDGSFKLGFNFQLPLRSSIFYIAYTERCYVNIKHSIY